jgi:hypothetical protein
MLSKVIKTLILDMCVDKVFDRIIKQVTIPSILYIGKEFEVLVLDSIYESNAERGIFYGVTLTSSELDENGYEYNFTYESCKVLLRNGMTIYSIEDGEFDAFDYDVYDTNEFSFLESEINLEKSK